MLSCALFITLLCWANMFPCAQSCLLVSDMLSAGDPFEQLVNMYLEQRGQRLSTRLQAGVRSSLSRFGALIKKHRGTGSVQQQSSFGANSIGSGGVLGLGQQPSSGDLFGGSSSSSSSQGFGSGLIAGLRSGNGRGGGGLSGSFADRPESVKMRQMVSTFAAAAEQMRRSLATTALSNAGNNKSGEPGGLCLCVCWGTHVAGAGPLCAATVDVLTLSCQQAVFNNFLFHSSLYTAVAFTPLFTLL